MLIIDRKHKLWLLACSVISILAVGAYNAFEGVTAGTALGLSFGVIALLLMLYATLLWANRWIAKGWLLFPRQVWLRGHIWLGSLSVLFVVLHAGGLEWGGLLTQILWTLTFLTVGSGVVGLVLQQFLPRQLTRQVADEVPILQLDHACREIRRQADIKVESCCGMDIIDQAIENALVVESANDATQQVPQELDDSSDKTMDEKCAVARFYATDVRPFLEPTRSRHSLSDAHISEAAFDRVRRMQLSADLGSAIDQIEDLCRRRRELEQQARLHRWLHGWLLVHVPFSLALMLLGIVHAVMSIYF